MKCMLHQVCYQVTCATRCAVPCCCKATRSALVYIYIYTYIRIRGPGGLGTGLGAARVGRGAEIECFSRHVSRGGFVRFRMDFGGVREAEDGQQIDFQGSFWRPFPRRRFRKVFWSIFGGPEPRKSSSRLHGSTIFAKSTFSKKLRKKSNFKAQTPSKNLPKFTKKPSKALPKIKIRVNM